MKFWSAGLVLALLVVVLSACLEEKAASPGQPAGHRTDGGDPVRGSRHIVAAAHPLAAEAGREILRAGGNAVDAAIAVQLMLNLVEPQSSGIGGGGFLLYFDAASAEVFAYDGRETAPEAAHAKMFLDERGQPKGFFDAAVGGLAVGVPGLLRVLEMAHRDHGQLPWRTLFHPAIHAARQGFTVTPRLADLIAKDGYLSESPTTARYFYRPDGTALTVGSRRDNPDLAKTLEEIATLGAGAFYTGSIADDIAVAVQTAYRNPGGLSQTDLAAYRAKRREPICRAYRHWTVCGMPPPSSGGIATLQILGLLEHTDMAALQPSSVAAVHRFAEASKIAFADRNAYVADPDFVRVPTSEMLDRGYLAERSRLIGTHALRHVAPGNPMRSDGQDLPPPQVKEKGDSTTHFSIADGDGNVVSMTSSIENVFGARIMVRGFLLNNQLTDFSFVPQVEDNVVANRPGPGKRPRSSMSPTIVFDRDGQLALAIGSPGGSRIIDYVALSLVAALDWELDIQHAINLPRIVNLNGPTELEQGTYLESLRPSLKDIGHEVVVRTLTSGLHGIARTDGYWTGGADPRREGVVLVD